MPARACSCPSSRRPATTQRGMIVEVWTSDDQRFLYEIAEVRRDQTRPRRRARRPTREQLWLQTSEGPNGTPGKTQVIAEPLSGETAPTPTTPTRRRSRSSAAEAPAVAQIQSIRRRTSGGPGRRQPRSPRSRARSPASPPRSPSGLAHPEDAGHRADAGEDHGDARSAAS